MAANYSSLTTLNNSFYLTIEGLYDTPQLVQGFSTDDAYDFGAVDVGQIQVGVDGYSSGGLVINPHAQTIVLIGDSPSVDLFEGWYAAQVAGRTTYRAQGLVTLPSAGKSYTLTNGFLSNGQFGPQVKKILSPRTFTINWAFIVPVALSLA